MVSKDEQKPLLNKNCPLRQLIDIIGDKWTLPVLYVLRQDTKRYSEIQHEIPGISRKMLTQTLRKLETDNILKRTVYAVVPPKTEYNLTAFGSKLIEPLEVLADWAWEHRQELHTICDRRQLADKGNSRKKISKSSS